MHYTPNTQLKRTSSNDIWHFRNCNWLSTCINTVLNKLSFSTSTLTFSLFTTVTGMRTPLARNLHAPFNLIIDSSLSIYNIYILNYMVTDYCHLVTWKLASTDVILEVSPIYKCYISPLFDQLENKLHKLKSKWSHLDF